ncbi:MAG: class I SAM-dependent methyltransferase [Xenococcaceae cyanobacterium]
MNSTQTNPQISLASYLVNQILAVKPLASFAKNRARNMMIKRAESIGVPWRDNVQKLSDRDWNEEIAEVENRQIQYPDYYLNSFHAYEKGNLSWEAAWEVESAAHAVHAKIWSEGDKNGDARLRQSYHQILRQKIEIEPHSILDLGCGVGMSTFALQEIYPQAKLTGVDLSPYFLAVAKYRDRAKPAAYSDRQKKKQVNWLHAAAESTELPSASFDLVSACLVFHELPQTAAKAILLEARRLLKPGGYLGIMDMNPRSTIYQKMPPFILTLLKSTEPYLDEYFTLDISSLIKEVGFTAPDILVNSPRHRTIIAKL